MLRYLTIIILTFLSLAFVFKTETNIKGCVTDAAGESLIGVSILLKGSTLGTLTDLNGCFSLKGLPEPPFVIVASYMGYAMKEIHIEESVEELTISLEEERVVLEEVVVISSSMSSTKESRKDRRRRDRASDAASVPSILKGKTAGVSIAGKKADKIMIRGYSGDIAYSPASSMAVSDEASFSGFTSEGESLRQAAGQLTAGELNDFSKWDMWADIAQEDLAQHRAVWKMYPDHRYAVQITNELGTPLINCQVSLRDDSGQIRWQARTDNTGKAELWASMFSKQGTAFAEWQIVATYDGREYNVPAVKSFQDGINFLQIPVACDDRTEVDIAFVVDATGSMGDEISYLQAELMDVITRIQDTLPESDLRTASVFYRDVDDDYLTRQQDFSRDAKSTLTFIEQQEADGGGDTPEAVASALAVAIEQLSWRDEASTRLLFLVLDAPPHAQDSVIKRMHTLSRLAAAAGIRIIPVTGSGVDKSTEYLMRSLALATNGTYTFLTDHSGIGGHHIEPSTDEYKVEKLNDLLVRLGVQFGESPNCEPVFAIQNPQDTVQINLPTLQPNANPESWRFFPNPSAGPVNLSFSGKGDGTLYLADSNGKLLQRMNQPGKGRQMNFGQYPSGQYLLIYENKEGSSSTGRLIIARS